MAVRTCTDADFALARRSALFSTLGLGEAKDLRPHCKIQICHAQQLLFEQGQTAEHLFIILDGWVQLYRDRHNGTRSVIHLLGPRESFAEALLEPGSLYPVTAQSATDARLVAVELSAVRRQLATSPDTALAVIASTLRHLRKLVDQVEQANTWSARQRVASFLLTLCPEDASAVRLILPLEQKLLAARLKMTPSTFTRALQSLSTVGVTASRGEVAIQSVDRLAQLIRDPAEGRDCS